MSAISVSDLHKSYGDYEALRGISFEIAEGEVFGLLGPNGAGKTTTVEILEGYRRRDAGTVDVLGFDPEQAPRAFREQIGVVLRTGEPTKVLHELTSEAVADGRELEGLEVRRPTLEEVYLALVEEEEPEPA